MEDFEFNGYGQDVSLKELEENIRDVYHLMMAETVLHRTITQLQTKEIGI